MFCYVVVLDTWVLLSASGSRGLTDDYDMINNRLHLCEILCIDRLCFELIPVEGAALTGQWRGWEGGLSHCEMEDNLLVRSKASDTVLSVLTTAS